MLQKYDSGASKHIYDIVTGYESWIYAYELESKQQLTVWLFQDDPNPTKVVRARSVSKQMICSDKLGMSQMYDYNTEQSILIGTQRSRFET